MCVMVVPLSGLPERHEGVPNERLLSLQARVDERSARAPRRGEVGAGERKQRTQRKRAAAQPLA